MRVPVPSPQKPAVSCNPTTAATSLCYEPTSVLDLHSPVAEKTPPSEPKVSDALSRSNDPSLDWIDEHDLQNLDWDSLMKDIGNLHDDSAPPVKSNTIIPCDAQIPNLPEFPSSQPFDSCQYSFNIPSDLYPNQNMSFEMSNVDFHNFGSWNFGFEFVEDLIRAADWFDSNELQLMQVTLTRLNQRLQCPVGKPLQRAAFYFKEALQSLLTGSNRSTRLSSWPDIVQTIRAYKVFSGISPVPMFSHFTANQALLEALHGSILMHVIDFDIGLGGQYASFMREIAERAENYKINTLVLRITAVVPEDYAVETRLIRENLTQFAQELKIRFHIDFVLVRSFDSFTFKAIKFMEGEKTAVMLSPAIFHRLDSPNGVFGFVSDLRRISPSVVVFIDSDGWMEGGATSFRRNFVNSLEFYTTMLESLDTAAGMGEWVRKIETFVLQPKILAAVEGAARRAAPPWREVFHGAGMRPVQLSRVADFQAECLLGKVQVRGFQVAKRQAELVLCWHERALVATSAWRC